MENLPFYMLHSNTFNLIQQKTHVIHGVFIWETRKKTTY